MRTACPVKLKIVPILFSILELSAACSNLFEEEDPFKAECLTANFQLPSELDENSGMIWYDGLIWTINDSYGDPFIYALDTATASIVRRVKLAEAENNDWEEIAQDETSVYVGDFGNNDGTRKDLRIYKISKSALYDTLVVPEVIQFSYPDQTDFTPALYNTPYDCEAMISAGDTLLLFSKNWTGGDTRIYKVPAVPGNYIAVLCESLAIDGQVTASTYSTVDHCLYLLGYYNYTPFICLIEDFASGEVDYSSIKQHTFSDNFGTQTEGIALTDKQDILVSCEKGYGTPVIYKVTPCN